MADVGDAATWSGVAASVVFSGAALVVSLHSLRHSRRAADAAERQAIAAEKALPPPPPPVAWEIVYLGKEKYALRNHGTETATGVKIDARGATSFVRLDDGGDATIRPRGSVPFTIARGFGEPLLQEVWVSWDGHPEQVPVPIPPEA